MARVERRVRHALGTCGLQPGAQGRDHEGAEHLDLPHHLGVRDASHVQDEGLALIVPTTSR